MLGEAREGMICELESICYNWKKGIETDETEILKEMLDILEIIDLEYKNELESNILLKKYDKIMLIVKKYNVI